MALAPPKQKSITLSQRAVLTVFFLLCSTLSIGVCLWLFKDELRLPHLVAKVTKLRPQPARYALLTEDLGIRKKRLHDQLLAAESTSDKEQVISNARELLLQVAPEMMRCWLGTRWDYNGHCQSPGSGKIACGYFVATIMRDCGFKLDRIKLAQQPSQTILNAFVPSHEMDIRTGMEFDPYWQMLLTKSPGIYIIGLDKHVGFLVHHGDQIQFIHSSGSFPKCVVEEPKNLATAIKKSRYRVVGNLTEQNTLIEKWLLDETIYPK